MIQKNARLVTAEAVRKGHPDKFEMLFFIIGANKVQ